MDEVSASSPYRSTPVAFGGWLLAGLPILASAIQAVGRLTGTPVGSWPVLGPVSAAVMEVEVFRQMSVAFDPESLIVLMLFLLVSVSWVTLGLSLFRPFELLRDYSREVRGGSVLATTVLYGLLFLGSYWQLLTSSIGIVGVTTIIGLPIVVFSGIYLAYTVQPRTNGNRLLNIVEERLNSIEREVAQSTREINAELSELGSGIQNRTFSADAGESVASGSRNVPDREKLVIADAEQEIRKLTGRINGLRERVEEIRSYPEAKREREADELLRKDIDALDAEATARSARCAAKAALADWLDGTLSDKQLMSSEWERPYKIGEHDDHRYITQPVGTGPDEEIERFRTDELSAWAETGSREPAVIQIHVDEVSELADEFKEDAVGLEIAVSLLNAVGDHFTEVKEELRQRESEFADVTQEVETEVDQALETFGDLPGELGTRMEAIYLSGVDETIEDVGSISCEYGRSGSTRTGELDQAIELHHDCRFDIALDVVEEAREMARQLNQVANLIKQTALTVEEGVDSFTIPEFTRQTNPFFTRELLTRDVNARLDGVEIHPDWQRGRLEYSYTSDDTKAAGVRDEETDDDQSGAIIQDGVRWLFNSLRSESIGETHKPLPGGDKNGEADVVVEVHRDSLPEIKSDPEIIYRAAEHIDRQSGIDAEVDRSKTPDSLTFEVRSQGDAVSSQRQIGDELLDSFNGRSGYRVDNQR